MNVDNKRWTLQGKVAVVTGGTKGIGKAICTAFLEHGAVVVTCSRSAENLENLKDELSQYKDRFFTVQCNVENQVEVEQLHTFVKSKFNKVDVLVNNVGTNIRKPSIEYTHSDLQSIFATNLFSAYSVCVTFFELLQKSSSASIVNVSSVASVIGLRTGIPYAMTKSALTHGTKVMALEWAKFGIRCNVVSPWYIYTPLTKAVLDNVDYKEQVLARTPLGRIGMAEEVADVVTFLSMEASSYVTGQNITIDGGFSNFGF